MRIAFGLLIALCCCDAAAAQQRIVMYRCTDAKGAVTLQNDVRCPKGSKQEKRVIETPAATAPTNAAAAPSAAPAATSAPVTAAQPALAAAKATPPAAAPALVPSTPPAALVPPPALYRCANLQREVYFSDTDLQPRRCVPMQAVGLDGNPATGAGTVCEMMRDPCQPIADQQLCPAWRQRAEEARTAARFGTGEQAANAKAALERSQTVLRESCPAE
ncbi:DUF4124 domain-containing protein [Luteimonas gilva]|uniref:DUF4124 domain-containing protein n=1 Tax=Luteimonas gilva TaxID=2572684 RepID=A0A4U5JNR6_9GAMM|nr:DUF4124 domain-containing protein [Luteimonas gilva]TKR30426.1 DUF4124 domain-containing protein [Luteimonas gilva]